MSYSGGMYVLQTPHELVGEVEDMFFFELLAGVGDAARERDCDIHVSHVAPASFEDLHAAMTTHRADGVIFVGQSALHHAFNQLAESETQFVVWGAELPEQNYCSVGSDNLLGGERATQHLARLGRERIVFLGETEAPEAMQRYRGYRTALSRAKLAEDPDLLVPAHFSLQSAQSAIEALLARGVAFDGVIAASDVMALGALRALHRAGKRVPHDVSLVGYDNISYARYSEPALTTVDQDVANAGRLMLAKLLDGQRGAIARSERLATDLIVRESCGA